MSVSKTIKPIISRVRVCPSPQKRPTHKERHGERSRATMLETAIKWSESNACFRPNTNPKPSVVSGLTVPPYREIIARTARRRPRDCYSYSLLATTEAPKDPFHCHVAVFEPD